MNRGRGQGLAAAGPAFAGRVGRRPVSLGGGGLLGGKPCCPEAISALQVRRELRDELCRLPRAAANGRNCAGRPVTFSEVWMATSVLPVTSAGFSVACTFAGRGCRRPRVSLAGRPPIREFVLVGLIPCP